ncbi:SCO5918 family protein [Streptomyces sp. NPDC059868]|uniref:SCO5918 family protein n=1 Tax=unclassified Streptomyces TaxID=2593676 RepID=UPI000960666B|nr:hypothetical protein AMK31_17385 [Streptomyces sp. TSRI0107]
MTPALPAVGSFAELTTELITGESVTIGRRRHPVRQAGRIITRQVSRGFTSGEVVRAVTGLGFTCHEHPVIAPAGFPAPLQVISALLGRTAALEA